MEATSPSSITHSRAVFFTEPSSSNSSIFHCQATTMATPIHSLYCSGRGQPLHAMCPDRLQSPTQQSTVQSTCNLKFITKINSPQFAIQLHNHHRNTCYGYPTSLHHCCCNPSRTIQFLWRPRASINPDFSSRRCELHRDHY